MDPSTLAAGHRVDCYGISTRIGADSKHPPARSVVDRQALDCSEGMNSPRFMSAVLKSRHLNGWPLLFWIMAVNALAVLTYMPTQDLSAPTGVSEMIQMSVRCTIPLLLLVFPASSLHFLFRSKTTGWLLSNRRYLGLAYASAMGWQLFFILWMWLGHWDYYTAEVYDLESIIFQGGGYILIFAMTVTSFFPVRRQMSALQWQVLHKAGIYWLWFTIAETYYYEIAVYDDRQIIDYIYFAGAVIAYLFRVAAWARSHTGQPVRA